MAYIKRIDPQKIIKRLLEILPGAMTWGTLVGMIVFSFIVPLWVAIFIIMFDIFWLLRGLHGVIHLLWSFRKIRLHRNLDWLERCGKLGNLPAYLAELKTEIKTATTRAIRNDLKEEYLRISKLAASTESLNWRQIWHLVILPTYLEGENVLATSISSFLASSYPKNRIILVLALEGREGKNAVEKGKRLKQRFGNAFAHFLITTHPDGIPGETRVKGANISYAARKAADRLTSLQIPYEDVIVSTFDADTCVAPNYFAYLSYTYLVTKDRLRASYQPLPVYNNNLWEVPALTRVVAVANSFWPMIEASRADRLVTFSSHAMPFRTLVDVDFWPADVIPDDSRIFWKCFIHFHGRYRTVPLFTNVSMDAVLDRTHWRTLVGQYKQQRRWAYGVSDIPYMVPRVWPDRLTPFWKKLVYTERLLIEAHYFRSTASIMIALLGWLPILVGGGEFGVSVLAVNLPVFTKTIMSTATLFLIGSLYVSMAMLPPRPSYVGKWATWSMVFQWFLVPIVSTIFGSLPAIDAQTRLMLGRYMEFWVTPKIRRPVLSPVIYKET